MRRCWPSLIALQALAAATAVCAQATLTPKMRAAETTRLKAQLLEQMRDPRSTRLSDLALFHNDAGDTVSLCGQVNGTNGHGGFTGKLGFVSSASGLVVFQGETGSADFGAIASVWCRTKL